MAPVPASVPTAVPGRPLVPRSWLVLVYGSLLVPFVGPVLLALGSSLAYFRLRRKSPSVARALNRHAWIAIAINVSTNIAFAVLVRR
jgi:hypothetical protein